MCCPPSCRVEAHARRDRLADLVGLSRPADRRADRRLARRAVRPAAGDRRRRCCGSGCSASPAAGRGATNRCWCCACSRGSASAPKCRWRRPISASSPRQGARPFRAAVRAGVPDRPGRRRHDGPMDRANLGWQYLFFVGGVPALFALFMMRNLPESPRWLASRGRLAEAARCHRVHRESRSWPRPASRCRRPKPHSRAARRGRAERSWSDLFGDVYLRRTLVIWVAWFATYFVNYGLTTWLPTIYQNVFKLPLERGPDLRPGRPGLRARHQLRLRAPDRPRRPPHLVRDCASPGRGGIADAVVDRAEQRRSACWCWRS